MAGLQAKASLDPWPGDPPTESVRTVRVL
jgi:hypothetical protein